MGDGYEMVAAGDGSEVRLTAAAVRHRAVGSAVVAGVVTAAVAAVAAPVVAFLLRPVVGDEWVVGTTAAVAAPAAALVAGVVARAVFRRVRQDGTAVLRVGADGQVRFDGDELVCPGRARAVWVERERQSSEDGGVDYYRVSVDQPGGPVWLPVPLAGAWDGRASRKPAYGFGNPAAAGRYAAAVAAALGVPLVDKAD